MDSGHQRPASCSTCRMCIFTRTATASPHLFVLHGWHRPACLLPPLFFAAPRVSFHQPVVGVFDLGARAFEGIRNASRMDEDSDEDDSSRGRRVRGSDSQQQLQHSHPSSPRALGVIQEGVSSESAWLGGGAAGLLSLRARPPRMFGPLGEMDPFTWESAVAQAILRAVMRDDGDLPMER